MMRARFHVSTLLRLTLVSACAAMVILWPNWRVALQEVGYNPNARMTGGGGCTTDAVNVTHGFALHCTPGEEPNNLQVNWRVQGETGSHRFHLEALATAVCTDDPSSSEGRPVAGFDTYIGSGTGRYDGAAGAMASWVFTDKGEPGKHDTLVIVISQGSTPVLVVSCTLTGGNHQAHPE